MRRKSGLVLGLILVLSLVVIVRAAPSQQETELDLFIFNLRTDMEFIADEVFGVGERPENWTFESDPNTLILVLDYSDPTLVSDLWFDGEQLANAVFGENNRPGAWFGATSRDPIFLTRNVRHDLELTADEVFGSPVRPQTWAGAEPLVRCSQSLQNLVYLAEASLVTTTVSVDYCRDARIEFMTFHLPNLLDQQGGISNIDELAWWMRGDLERYMDEKLGVGNRPINWIGNIELGSRNMLDDINRDLERLASDEFTPDVRPAGWLPFVPDAFSTSYINLRNNLELFMDAVLGIGVRPANWQGGVDDPLAVCAPLDRAMIEIGLRDFAIVIDPNIDIQTSDCGGLVADINFAIENVPEEIAEDIEELSGRYVATSKNAFSYLDVSALDFMGIMPWGTEFRAWYRNFAGSNMMFVSGTDFALFIDRRWTTMDETVFNTLDTLEDVKPLTFCDAVWCNGPGPTPTPTGSDPLELLVFGATIPPTPDITEGGIIQTGKLQVTWNHIRVTYVGDFPDRRVAQVALEICVETQQITCEPVQTVYDNRLGVFQPVLFQTNGLNVYEIAYGYVDYLLFEGATLVSPAIFISDPTIR